MNANTIMTVSAFLALIPATVYVLKPRESRDLGFWAVALVALAGPLGWSLVQLSGEWHTGFSATLWLIVSSCTLLFILTSALTSHGWRLAPLLLPYLLLLGGLAAVWSQAPERPLMGMALDPWLRLHILFSLVSYGLLTLAAVSGLAVFLHERALKQKIRPAFNSLLPSVMDSEALELQMLRAAESVLGLGILTGMATLYFETGRVMAFDHKTLFSLLAFGIIAVLLVMRTRTGVRGRQAARFVLLAYLLLTLGYPGVKFVTDVLMG
ncbi:MAG: cytochrome c biogenesis protein CcsA [Alphaproteobacteria bacterium]|jgi:ABC-type uncharacterized transport system permease subunit|nr:hypothetical protein [Rhodospirillaceae bacterium]MDP6659963.1 cytochrome c biogenesis protein CcsA [Alphaproteobacteria bacterium]MDP6780139.1 cytochrome c biogenesis protein CcsA [Alphaproteobacteria bacterium]MDP7044565.1 cytochrome c biogenesis protein CcsA [Alphaproteobacteria bacterium]